MLKARRSGAPAPAFLSLILALGAALPATAQNAVPTQHTDNARTGAYTTEKTLTLSNVNVNSFGKLYTLPLDANVNGQVLYVPGVTVNGAVHNVIYAYTSNNNNNSPSSLYAFDAGNGSQLWRHQFPNSARWTTCTPAIDTTAKIIYVVTKSNDDNGNNYLRALDISSGAEKPGSPIEIRASAAGTGDGNVNGTVSLTNSQSNCRPGLLLVGGNVYVGFAHNTDSFPYQGWVLGYHYNGAAFTQTAVFCTAPNGGDSGVWSAGKGLTADAAGYIYFCTGNGSFDANTGGVNYGMCYIKLSTPNLAVVDWFAPFDEQPRSDADQDLANSGVVGIPGTTRMFGGATKFGAGFLLDSGNMGHFTSGGPDNVLNRLDNLTPNYSVSQNPVAWDSGTYKYVYLWANNANLEQFRYDPATGKFNPGGIYITGTSGTSGASLALSSNGTANGILWAAGYNGTVHAYNASSVSNAELWNSTQNSTRDGLGSVGHFQFPTVANGKVYVPTGSASVAVYGLLAAPPPPSTIPVAGDSYVRAGAYNATNYGTSARLISKKVTNNASNSSNCATYLKFDLSKLTAPPSQALLQLTVATDAAPVGSTQNVQVFGLPSTGWAENMITWNNAPGLNRTTFTSTGTLITTQGVVLTPGVVTIDVTSFIAANIGKGITLQLFDATPQNLTLTFNSLNATSGKPALVLTK